LATKVRGTEEIANYYRHEAETLKHAVPVGVASCNTTKHKPQKYEYAMVVREMK